MPLLRVAIVITKLYTYDIEYDLEIVNHVVTTFLQNVNSPILCILICK